MYSRLFSVCSTMYYPRSYLNHLKPIYFNFYILSYSPGNSFGLEPITENHSPQGGSTGYTSPYGGGMSHSASLDGMNRFSPNTQSQPQQLTIMQRLQLMRRKERQDYEQRRLSSKCCRQPATRFLIELFGDSVTGAILFCVGFSRKLTSKTVVQV